MNRPPLPPFIAETASQKARMAEDAWSDIRIHAVRQGGAERKGSRRAYERMEEGGSSTPAGPIGENRGSSSWATPPQSDLVWLVVRSAGSAAGTVTSRKAKFVSCPSVTDIDPGANEQRNTRYQRRQGMPEQIAHERDFKFPSTRPYPPITGLFPPTGWRVR
jgi:hypothetical protein